MISFIVRMRFDAEDTNAVRDHLLALSAGSRREPGCISYIAHTAEDDAGAVLIYEQYADQAALDHHRESGHFAQHAIGGLYQLMKERSMETLIALA